MTFVVNTIKQDSKESKKSQNIQFLVDEESPLFVRKLIQESGLVLLSLNDFSNKIESFGPLYVVVTFENKSVRIVGKKDFNLKDLILFFLRLKFNIEDANYFVNSQSVEQIKNIIDLCQKELNEQQKKEKANVEQQIKQEKKMYDDEGLGKAKKVIEWALEKVNSLLLEKGAFISAKDLRTIKDKIEELKKLRMGTNYEKIRDMLQELFSMVDGIEESYYESLEDKSESLFAGTDVTNIDLERQVSILEKVQQQQMFGGKVPVSRKDYVAFGDKLIYLFFLKKDFLILFKNLLLYVYRLFDFVEMWLIIVLIMIGLGILYMSFGGSESYMAYYSLFSLGFLGIINYIFSFVKAKNPLFVGALFLGMIILYFITIPILKHTFALS